MLRRPLAVLLPLLVLVVPVPVASANPSGPTDGLEVIVLVEPRFANYGEDVNMTVHVFDGDVYVDPSAISASVDDFVTTWPLNLTRTAVGRYGGRFDFSSHPTRVTAIATVDGRRDSGSATVFHDFVDVRMVAFPAVARPGDPVTVTVEVSDDGVPLEADSLDLTYALLVAPSFEPSDRGTLTWTRVGVGLYSGEYRVPQTVASDAVIDFRTDVRTPTGGAGVGTQAYVDFQDPLLVWYRTTNFTSGGATLQVYVARPSGIPQPGAEVSLTYPGLNPSALRAATDSGGAAKFELRLDSVAASFYGVASVGSLRQGFSGALVVPPPPPPGEVEFRRDDPEGTTFGPGDIAVLRYVLLQAGTPSPNQDILVYGHTFSELLFANRMTTDASGRFEVRFETPRDTVLLEFAANIEGAWRTDVQAFWPEYRLAADVRNVDGWTVRVSGIFPSSAGPWMARVEVGTRGVRDPWRASGSFGSAAITGADPSSPFAMNIALPRFLREGEELFVEVVAESPRDDGDYVLRDTVVVGAASSRPDVVPVLGVLLVFAAVILTLLVSDARVQRRSPRR